MHSEQLFDMKTVFPSATSYIATLAELQVKQTYIELTANNAFDRVISRMLSGG